MLGTRGCKRLGLPQGSVAGSEPCVVGKFIFSDFFRMHTSSSPSLPYGGFMVMMGPARTDGFHAHCLSAKRPHLLHLSGSAHLEDLSREAIIGS